MKTNLEKTYAAKRESAEALVAAEYPGHVELLCSFSNLDCIIDVKFEDGWQRFELVEGGDDEPNELRRIG